MPVIPPNVSRTPFHSILTDAGLRRCHQGKVRDTYTLPDKNLLLVLATNRISIFDSVLPCTCFRKGQLLTALTVFWLDEVLTSIPHHLVAFGKEIDKHLPKKVRGDDEIYRHSMVVQKLDMLPVECIVRGYLTGSGWAAYKESQQVCGIPLPEGLHDGSRIVPDPIFTPTTKSKNGHDKHIPAAEVRRRYGPWPSDRSLEIYKLVSAVAEKCGLILADTKLEFGRDGTLADEVATPDSSRFWNIEDWDEAAKKSQSPPPYDKELLRGFGREHGIHKLDPENMEDLELVARTEFPRDILIETMKRYERVLTMLTGCSNLGEFQKKKMNIPA